MSVVPKKAIEKVQYFENHISPWTTNAVVIGTTDAEVAALDTKTQLARSKYDAQQVAREAAVAATEAFHNAVAAMNIAGVGIMGQVRIKAETTGNPNIYELAVIPGPVTPEPKGPPGTATGLTVVLNGNGSLHLKWKCPNPAGTSGTVYQVWRRFGGVGEFTYLSGSGGKTYTDNTIPAGETQVTYMIQAVRSTAVGMWATFNVNFGTNVAGATTATVTESASSASPKLAA